MGGNLRGWTQLQPEHSEEYVDFLMKHNMVDEALQKLVEITNDESFVSVHGKTKHSFWMEICDLIAQYPEQVCTKLKSRGRGASWF